MKEYQIIVLEKVKFNKIKTKLINKIYKSKQKAQKNKFNI